VPSTLNENNDTNTSDQVTSRYNISEDARKSKERFIEKEREQAKMEAKKRKLEEKRVNITVLSLSV